MLRTVPLALALTTLVTLSGVTSAAAATTTAAEAPRVLDIVEGRIPAPRESDVFWIPGTDASEVYSSSGPLKIADEDKVLLDTALADTCVLAGLGDRSELVPCSDFEGAELGDGIEIVPLDGIGRWDVPSNGVGRWSIGGIDYVVPPDGIGRWSIIGYAPTRCAWLEAVDSDNDLVELIMRYEGVVVADTCVGVERAIWVD